MTTPELPLCICHHFRNQHAYPDEAGTPCTQCKCMQFQPVSHKSSHVYQRGVWTGRKRIDMLRADDRVLVTHNGDRLLVAEVKADALVAYVMNTEREEPAHEDRFTSAHWRWRVVTDLGMLNPLPGPTMTMIVKGQRW